MSQAEGPASAKAGRWEKLRLSWNGEQSNEAGDRAMDGSGVGDGLDREAESGPRPEQSLWEPRPLEERDGWSGCAGHRQEWAVDGGVGNVECSEEEEGSSIWRCSQAWRSSWAYGRSNREPLKVLE